MNIAFLGLGKMGAAIARHLAKGSDALTVWNRTPQRAEAFAASGAKLARTAAEATASADVVFTMLIDDAAMEEVLERGGVLESLGQGAAHVSLSTLSVALSKKLTEEHSRRGQLYIASPVFGRPSVAEAGRLWLAAAGEPHALEKVRPLLEKFSRGITVVGRQPWSAHAMKLGGNFLITAMIASLTEGFVYAQAMGIEPAVYLETVNKALFQSPYYEAYGKVMLDPPATPGATMAVGAKDMRLFREAAHADHVKTPLADLFMETFHRALEAGMKDADWAAGYLQLQRAATREPAHE